jgi:hypothetical protein
MILKTEAQIPCCGLQGLRGNLSIKAAFAV